MDTLEYLPINKQIEKLKSQHLNFDDEEKAKILLKVHGYYDIINGYREPYIFITETGEKQYKKNVTFEQIYNLFVFDQIMRDAIMMSMVDLEGHLKAVVSDIIGSSFGVDHTTYLDRNNYRDKYVTNPKFSRNEILYTLLKSARFSNKQPLKHYREKYGLIPPWILFKDTFFATLVNLVRFLKAPERNILVQRLYGAKVTEKNIDAYKDFLSDTLFMCLDYRNRTAHGGRIYNYVPQHTLRAFMNTKPREGLPQLVFAFGQLEYNVPEEKISSALDNAISNYCRNYSSPDDINLLGNAIGFTITQQKIVFVNEKTKTYHIDNRCSGSHNLKKVFLNDALPNGYKPCKRCCVTKNN